jgi:hypothetical protein
MDNLYAVKVILKDFFIASLIMVIACILNGDFIRLINESYFRLIMLSGALSAVASLFNINFLNWKFDLYIVGLKVKSAICLMILGGIGQQIFHPYNYHYY